MTKNSILKKLLAIGVGTVCVTTGALFAACDKDKDKDKDNPGGDTNTTHTHQWSTGNEASAWGKNATHHWRICLAEGHGEQGKTDATGYGAHVYDNDQDASCNTCGYTRTIGGGEENPGAHTNVTVNASDLTLGTLTDGTSLGTGVKITGTPAVDANSKSVIYKGETISVAKRIKLSSKLTNKDTPMGIEVTTGAAAKVIVYYYSGSSGQTRGVELYKADKTLVDGSTQALSDGNVMATAMFDITAAGTYYIGASVAGVNVYYLAVIYDEVGETWTPHEAKPAACEVAGNIAYSESNYGRYKDENDNLIMANKYTVAALKHSYTLKADSLSLPTATDEGSATLTCANGHETNVELPVLTSDKYTARPAAGVEGTFTITVSGVQISFTAIGVNEQETTYTDVYKLDATNIVLLDNSVTSKTEGTNCVYRKVYASGSNSYSGSMDPTNAKGLYVGDSATRTDVRIALGTSINSGVVKISGTIEAGTVNSKWRFFQLHGSESPDAEALSFGLNANKKLQCWNGTDYAGTEAANAYSANTPINFEIIIDFTSKKVNVKFNDTLVLEDQTYGANDLSEIGLSVNNGRSVILHNVTIATQD